MEERQRPARGEATTSGPWPPRPSSTLPQIVCLPKSGQVALTPLELPGGLKAAMVPLSAHRAVVVESRRALGWDKQLLKTGAVVYTVDTSVKSGSGPIRVRNGQQALAAGESVTVDGVVVKVLASGAAGDTVSVVVP